MRLYRNPDDEGRILERALSRTPDDLVLRHRMLHAKLRAGRLHPANKLVALAHYLDDPNVPEFLKEIGAAPDTEFPTTSTQVQFERFWFYLIVTEVLLAETQDLDRNTRIETIAGITCLFRRIQDALYPILKGWVPTKAAINYTDEEIRSTPVFQRLSEVTGLEDQHLIHFARAAIHEMHSHVALDAQIDEFSKTLNIPLQDSRINSSATVSAHILTAIRRTGNRDERWKEATGDAANLVLADGVPMSPATKPKLYGALHIPILDALYRWDVILPADATLWPYLRPTS